jgi:hypothetical protein
MLGSEPVPEEIPYDRSDLAFETQMVFDLYDKLPSKWEGFSGQYLGKELNILPALFKEYNYPGYLRRYSWDLIPIIDNIMAKDIAKRIKSTSKGVKDGRSTN